MKKRSIFIFKEQQKNYTYITLFLLIFSIFIYFAIRPSLITIFSLNKEVEDLTKINNLYDNQINKILEIQSEIEKNRDRLYLLSQAITDFPQVNKIVSDIKNLADSNNFYLKNASILDINLFSSQEKNLKTVTVNIDGSSNFEDLLSFINGLFNQRRLKRIKKIIINKDQIKQSTNSGDLKVNMEIEGYYL